MKSTPENYEMSSRETRIIRVPEEEEDNFDNQ